MVFFRVFPLGLTTPEPLKALSGVGGLQNRSFAHPRWGNPRVFLKTLVLVRCGFLIRLVYPQDRRSYYLFFTTCSLLLV